MDATVNDIYAEYLEHTGGDKAAAASLTLAATLRDCDPATAEPAESNSPRALTAAEAADRLRVSRWTIYRLARTGQLSGYRAGGALRFTHDEIERFENQGGAAPPAEAAPLFPDIVKRHC
jgi:excisionase family DNA binding protein